MAILVELELPVLSKSNLVEFATNHRPRKFKFKIRECFCEPD